MFVTSAVLAASLSPEDFSAFGFFLMTATVFAAFSTLGVGATSSLLFARWNSGDQRSLLGIPPLWLVCLLAGALIGAGGILTVELWHPMPSQFSPILHFVAVVSISLGVVPQGGLLGSAMFKTASLVAIAAGVLILMGGYAGARAGSVLIAEVFLVGSFVLSFLLASAAVLRMFPQILTQFRSALRASEAWRAVSSVGPLALVSVLAASANWILGRRLLGGGDSAIQFSAFVLGLQWFGIVQLVPAMITKAAFPALASATRDSGPRRWRIIVASAAWASGAGALIAILVALGAGPLASIYGGGLSPTELASFSLAAIPSACANALGNALIAAGRGKAWLVISVCWFIVLMTLASLLLRYGAVGMAVSLGVAGLVMTVASIIAVRRMTHLPVQE